MITCYICIESVAPANIVTCLCKFEACGDCVRHYLLHSPLDPHCMKCKVAWNTEFLVNKLGKNFVYQSYKIHRQDVLLERELARLPEALETIQAEITEKQRKEELHHYFLERANALKQEADGIPDLPSLRQTTSKVLKDQGRRIDEELGLSIQIKEEAKRAFDEYRQLSCPLPSDYPDYALYVEDRVEYDKQRKFFSIEEDQWEHYSTRVAGLICRFDPEQDYLTQFRNRVHHVANKAALRAQAGCYLHYSEVVLSISLKDSYEARKPSFIRACPSEGCRGLLTEDWFCPMCRKVTCSKCQEIKEEKHTCLPESVETAKLLKQDTKPCPGCASMIFKIEGCDQMFCTRCGTAFSWRTGMKETGVIHNPHFYEYQRERAAQVQQEQPCQEYGGHSIIIAGTRYALEKGHPSLPLMHELEEILISYNHNRAVPIRYYDITPSDNLDLRLKFLKKELDETKLKELLQRRDKDYHKRRDYHGILSTYLTAQSDILRRAEKAIEPYSKCEKGESTLPIELVKPFIAESNTLREEFNLWLQKTAQYYNCVPPYIHSNYKIYKSANRVPDGK